MQVVEYHPNFNQKMKAINSQNSITFSSPSTHLNPILLMIDYPPNAMNISNSHFHRHHLRINKYSRLSRLWHKPHQSNGLTLNPSNNHLIKELNDSQNTTQPKSCKTIIIQQWSLTQTKPLLKLKQCSLTETKPLWIPHCSTQ